jgi:histidine triad (HIT) family protein
VTDACPFCAIARGELDAAVVARGPGWCAFLDRSPVFHGHVLVIPEGHHETLADLPLDEVAVLFGAVQEISRVLPRALEADGTFVAANNKISQSVPHLHVHVVPRKKKDGLRGFFWPRVKYGPGELEAYRDRIAAALAASE